MDEKSKRGGFRKGSGRKKTGINTKTISFSVHKDFVEPIKKIVRSEVDKLKNAKPPKENAG